MAVDAAPPMKVADGPIACHKNPAFRLARSSAIPVTR